MVQDPRLGHCPCTRYFAYNEEKGQNGAKRLILSHVKQT
nr:MAG TPA: hypothetical protein [Caudoviricetes sp.]